MRVSIIERALNKCFLMLARMDDMEMYNLYYMYEIASYTCKWPSLLIFMLGGDTQHSGTRQTSSPVLHFSSQAYWDEVVLGCHHITPRRRRYFSNTVSAATSKLPCQSRKEVRPKRGTEQHINPMGSYSLCAILELYGAAPSFLLLLFEITETTTVVDLTRLDFPKSDSLPPVTGESKEEKKKG